jgi:hypothetical protein
MRRFQALLKGRDVTSVNLEVDGFPLIGVLASQPPLDLLVEGLMRHFCPNAI